MHTERRNRRVTVFQARPAGLRPFMPTSYQLTTRFTKQNSKNKKAKHQEWSARGGGPTSTTRRVREILILFPGEKNCTGVRW